MILPDHSFIDVPMKYVRIPIPWWKRLWRKILSEDQYNVLITATRRQHRQDCPRCVIERATHKRRTRERAIEDSKWGPVPAVGEDYRFIEEGKPVYGKARPSIMSNSLGRGMLNPSKCTEDHSLLKMYGDPCKGCGIVQGSSMK